MLTVDTNVLVYAADVDSQFHVPCRNWLERQRTRPDAWYTTWGILYEFLRVTTHPRVMRRPWTAPALGNLWRRSSPLRVSPSLSRPSGTLTSPKRSFWSCLTSPETCCTMRTRQFSCASTALGGSALGIPISINSSFWKSSIRFDLVISVTDTAISARAVRTDHSD